MPSRRSTVLGAVIILALCAMCVRLGFWQLSRLEQRRARNAVAAQGLDLPPVVLESLADLDRDPTRWSYRRITVTGRYDPAREALLRGRSDSGRPGVHVVTPLRVGERILLVNRGWLPAPDGARPTERPEPPAGLVRVSGVLMEIPRTDDGGAPSHGSGTPNYRRLDLAAMRSIHGSALAPLYLQALPGGSSRLPRAVPVPPLDEGPHQGYAIQWFSFAAIGLIGLVVLLRKGRRSPQA